MTECVSALYAEGIHCESGFTEPFFLRESRRRMYAAVYHIEKTISLFLGRPPLMACRYSDRRLPLDLGNTTAWSDPDTVKAALEKLDEHGWNAEGNIWPTSWLRLRYQNSVVKERVIEQSLAGVADPDVTEKLQYVHCNPLPLLLPTSAAINALGQLDH
jgi:hypothetical protein